VLFEDLHRPDDALAELAAIPPRGGGGQTSAAQELRVRILLASGDRGAAAAALKRIAADPDTTVAYLGRYGLGRLAFLAGKYDESVKILSDLAEKHPSSAWANDALELAMDEKGAMPEGSGPLGLYRSAVFDRSRGELPAAADSLAEIGKRFPASYLAPRALFMKGEIEIDSAAPAAPAAGSPGVGGRGPGGPAVGGLAAARADFTKLAESYPLHDLAPRSLERLAELEARENPGEAVAQYARLMELYPDYPFMERVRERYIELGKTVGAEAPKKGSK